MADVVVVCVRDDIERAEALAAMFDDFGFSISDLANEGALRACGVGVVVWSEAAKASLSLAAAVERVMASGKGVVLNLSHAPAPEGAVRCFDLTDWDGDPDDEALDQLFFALDRMVIAGRMARPVEAKAVAQFEPIDAPPAPRVARAGPAPALRVMATSLVVIGAVLATGIAVGGGRGERAPVQAAVVILPSERIASRVTLADVTPRDVTYDLTASPVEDAPVGRRGLEPPSAANVR